MVTAELPVSPTDRSVWFGWAVRQALVELGLTVAALVVPGTTALMFRPQNAREGYIALSLAAAVLCWQAVRLTRLRILMVGEVIRAGRHTFRRSQLQTMRWHTTGHVGRPAHRLLALVDGEEFVVCRATATDTQAAVFTDKARRAGLPFPQHRFEPAPWR